MAGLSVLLETAARAQQRQHAPSSATTPQVISKSTLVNASNGRPSSSSPLPRASSMAPAPLSTTSSFLQWCFLCHKDLADGRDIYIYRGDRAFCSDECRCRHILMEEVKSDASMNCAEDGRVAPPGRRRRFCVLTI